jgi:hypothetical protein
LSRGEWDCCSVSASRMVFCGTFPGRHPTDRRDRGLTNAELGQAIVGLRCAPHSASIDSLAS